MTKPFSVGWPLYSVSPSSHPDRTCDIDCEGRRWAGEFVAARMGTVAKKKISFTSTFIRFDAIYHGSHSIHRTV
jgi:hypothetical protein